MKLINKNVKYFLDGGQLTEKEPLLNYLGRAAGNYLKYSWFAPLVTKGRRETQLEDPWLQVVNDFITDKNKTVPQEDKNIIYDKLAHDNTSKFDKNSILYAMNSESSFDPYSSPESSSALGYALFTTANFLKFFPDNWQEVQLQYINKTRSKEDAVNDAFLYYNWAGDRLTKDLDKMGYGRLKINLFAPNASLDDVVSDTALLSLTTKQRKEWAREGLTYRDLMNLYDQEFKEQFLDKYLTNFSHKSRLYLKGWNKNYKKLYGNTSD